MSLKKLYPVSEGFLHMKLTLTQPTELSLDKLKSLATAGNPEKYEIPHIEQRGKIVTAVTRHHDRIPTTTPS